MDEPVPAQPVVFHTPETPFYRKYWKIVIAIPTTLVIVLALNYFNIMPLSQQYPKYFNFLPHQSIKQATWLSIPQLKNDTPPVTTTNINEENLKKCDIKKDGNPLVSRVITLKNENAIVGTFTGNINKITYNSVNQVASIEIISPKGEQNYIFTVKEESGLVYDAVGLKALKLSDLKRGQTVVASFNCTPKQENSFKITHLAITG